MAILLQKNKTLAIIACTILTLLVGCDKLLPIFKKKKRIQTYLTKQYFLIDSDLYYSNGKDVYCDFKSWDHVKKYRGDLKNLERIIKYSKAPTGMVYVGKCDKRYDK